MKITNEIKIQPNSFIVQSEPVILWNTSIYPSSGTAPVLFDLNNDNVLDVIICSNSSLYAINGENGSILWNFPYPAPPLQPVVVGDINNDSKPEIVFSLFMHGVYALSNNGTLLWNFTEETFGYDSPILYDVNGDGQMEIFVGIFVFELMALDSNGSLLWTFSTDGDTQTLALGDINHDGRREIFVGTDKGTVYAIDAETGYLYWKFKEGSKIIPAAALGDVNKDGTTDVVIISFDDVITLLDGQKGKPLWQKNIPGASASFPVLGDVDGDGKLEIVFGSSNQKVYALNGEDGSLLWTFSTDKDVSVSPVLGDVDGDKRLDVVIGSSDGFLYAITGKNGSLIWKSPSGNAVATAALGDINRDGMMDIVTASTKNVFVLTISEKTSSFVTYWPCFGGNTNYTRNIEDWDPDHDMLSSDTERKLGTNPLDNDTDGDGLHDGWEVFYGLNPTHSDDSNADWDNDTLTNLKEAQLGTNPLSDDTDGDGIPDNWEVYNGYDPVNPNVSIFEYIWFNIMWVVPLIILGIALAIGGIYSAIRIVKTKEKEEKEKVIVFESKEAQKYKEKDAITPHYDVIDSYFFGATKAAKFPWLMLLVIVFSGILHYEDYVSYLRFTTVGISARPLLPWGFPDLGGFFEFSSSYTTLFFSPTISPVLGLITILSIGLPLAIVKSFLEAGYLGSIYSKLFQAHERGFIDSIIKYVRRILTFNLILFSIIYVLLILAVLPKILFGFYIAEYAVLCSILSTFVTYILVLVPYIIVAEDDKIMRAVKRSITYMFSFEAFVYVIIFSIITLGVSAVISILLSIPWIGYVLALIIVAWVGVALTISTFHFYERIKRMPEFKKLF